MKINVDFKQIVGTTPLNMTVRPLAPLPTARGRATVVSMCMWNGVSGQASTILSMEEPCAAG